MFSFFLQSCLILLGLHGFVHLGALTWYHIHGLLPHYLTVYYLLPFWRPETGGENGGGSNFFFHHGGYSGYRPAEARVLHKRGHVDVRRT